MNKVQTILYDSDNKLSSKRIVSFLFSILLIVIVIGHVFFEKKIDDYIYDGVKEIIIWSLGFIGSEKLVDMVPRYLRNKTKQGVKVIKTLPKEEGSDI
jgi:hypothetical protein